MCRLGRISILSLKIFRGFLDEANRRYEISSATEIQEIFDISLILFSVENRRVFLSLNVQYTRIRTMVRGMIYTCGKMSE